MSLRSRLPVPIALTVLIAVTALAIGAGAMAAPHAISTGSARVWKESVAAPAQFDLSLAEVRFRAPAHAAGSPASGSQLASSIRLAVRGTTGLDYVAAAVTRFSVRRRPRALVLVVNRRPRGSLAPDLARIGLTVTAAKRLGTPVLWQISDPFTGNPIDLTRAHCDLPIRAAWLTGGEVRSVLSRGAALSGFSGETAIAQAYNVVCRRPYDQTFKRVVTQGFTATCEAAKANIVGCCPPNAMCVPPPCPPCPCGPTPCATTSVPSPKALIVCPLQAPPIVCPL